MNKISDFNLLGYIGGCQADYGVVMEMGERGKYLRETRYCFSEKPGGYHYGMSAEVRRWCVAVKYVSGAHYNQRIGCKGVAPVVIVDCKASMLAKYGQEKINSQRESKSLDF